jgi:hypothetical protein
LNRYAGVPDTHFVALRWWFDKVATYAEQRMIIETAAPGSPFDSDIYRSQQLHAYRIYNPEKQTVDFYCQGSDGTFNACASNITAIVDKKLGNEPETAFGPIVGFLTMNMKKTRVVFKTLDTTKPKKPSSVGVECGNTSNLSDHHTRIRVLQAAGRSSDLAPLMLPDADEDWNEKGARKRILSLQPVHMKDITHHPLCLYMEFLTRMLETRLVGGNHWFLGAIPALRSLLKPKK